jgi:hypothetical protein
MNNKPIAWINEYDGLEPFNPDNRQEWIPLYTHPKLFTDEEVDAIYSAMGDYADYGDEETELANSIRNKLS